MPLISAVIITLNEEKNIERCLLSLKDIADEILIVDSYSSDRTEEICLKYNARFIQHRFEGYIEQKNWATQQATYDFVLSLDADEALSDELKASVRHAKENWDADGYTFNRLTNYCGKWIRHTSWYPSRKLRLWDRRKGRWDGFNPHDRFVMSKGAEMKHIHGDLLHFSYYTISQQINQINKFTDILAKAYHQRGMNATLADIIFRPLWRFLRDYFIKLGFLDGFYGFVVSTNASFEVFLKYLKLKKNIEIEYKKEPFRVCFMLRSAVDESQQEWFLNNVKRLNQKGQESFLVTGHKSDIVCQAKALNVHQIPVWLNRFTLYNPLNIYFIAKVLFRMRVKTIIVGNTFDAKIARLCSLLSGINDISIQLPESEMLHENTRNHTLYAYWLKHIFVQDKHEQLLGALPAPKVVKLLGTNNYELELSHFSKPAKVSILLDKISKPNCGLGRVAIDFSKALVHLNDTEVELNYIVYGNYDEQYLDSQKTPRLRIFNRLIPANFGKFDILHKLHQSPSFLIKGANQSILTIHDLNFLITKSKSKAKGYLNTVQKNVDKASAVVFISNFTKEVCLQHLKINANKIVKVIYNGVEIPDIQPKRPFFVTNDSYIFSIGQFLSKKNFHVLIPFLYLLPKNVKLIIAGENNTAYGSQIRKMASEYNLEDRVFFPGPVTEAEKLYLYQHCMAFVFPSLAEGFGLPVIEAMRNKKPVFCSDKTSLLEIGDKHVFFWRNFNPQEMLAVYNQGMQAFTDEKQHAAYNYSLKYSWETNAREYIELYKTILEQHV